VYRAKQLSIVGCTRVSYFIISLFIFLYCQYLDAHLICISFCLIFRILSLVTPTIINYFDQANMRSPTTSQPIRASENDITITTSTALNISIPLASKDKTKTKSRKLRPYRPVQRADGVITEYPRYQPSLSPSPSPPLTTKTFQAIETVLEIPAKPISRHLQLQRLREQNLRAVREFDAELARQKGRDGYNGIVEFGRSGYNGPAGGDECYQMRRFMRDDGPWTTYSTADEGRTERVRMGSEV
jgi:hypothetical protein